MLWTSNQYPIRTKTYVPKTLFAFFIILNLFFGLDFGFIRYLEKNKQSLAKCIWLIFSILIFAVFVIHTASSSIPFVIYWFVGDVIQFSLNFLILLYAKYNFLDYIEDLNVVDNDVSSLKKELLGTTVFAYAILPISGEIILDYVRCTDSLIDDPDACTAYVPFVYGLAVISPDVISTIYILIYYYMYCYVKKYNKMVKTSKISLQELQKAYMRLTDCFDKIMPLYDKLLSVQLLFEVQNVMEMVYTILVLTKNEGNFINYLSEAFYVAPIFVHLTVPFIATEILHAQLENLKLNLHKKLLEENDSAQINEIQKMLQYMESHHMQHKVWRFIPNDLRLPGAIFSMCVPYLIVLVQFTHLYD